jgi:transposase
MNLPQPQLTDEHRLLISDVVPIPALDPRGGRPSTHARRCLRSGARWKELQRSFPLCLTCWRRFVEWSSAGVWDQAWRRLVEHLDFRGVERGARIRRQHVRIRKKSAGLIGPTKRGKGTKLMLLVDGAGLPLAVDIRCASPAEVTLIEPLLCQAVTTCVPSRLIYDHAADSDALWKRLAERNIELICPHRQGRPLRRYHKRWIIERTISWLRAFRRLVTRNEFYRFLFHSFAKLASLMIVLRRC